MKAALLLALFGALSVVTHARCPVVAYYSCIKEEKPTKCKAVRVCEKDYKEACGDDSCKYPYRCAYAKKEECKKFAVLKEKCEKKKVCKEVKKDCGDGTCKLTQDCVKETKCYIKKSGRRLLDAVSYSGSHSGDNKAKTYTYTKADGDSKADAYGYAKYEDGDDEHDNDDKKKGYFYVYKKKDDDDKKDDKKEDDDKKKGYYYVYKKKDDDDKKDDKKEDDKKKKLELVCEDEYKCIAKEECKDVKVKKCVKKELRPGLDYCHGGYHFYWYKIHAGEKCGDEYCGYGYKCAEVEIQKCETECGDKKCKYGYECVVEDDDCKEYALLETVCKDVYKPTCVHLPPYVLLTYRPPCKTVYKCEKDESVCGKDYCKDGHVCAIDYKRACGYGYYPGYGHAVVSKPEKKHGGYKYNYYVKPHKHEKKDDTHSHHD